MRGQGPVAEHPRPQRPRHSPPRQLTLLPPPGYGERQSCLPFNIPLHSGDLLVMDPPTQLWWQHAVPRRLRLEQERLNLTFRVVQAGR